MGRSRCRDGVLRCMRRCTSAAGQARKNKWGCPGAGMAPHEFYGLKGFRAIHPHLLVQRRQQLRPRLSKLCSQGVLPRLAGRRHEEVEAAAAAVHVAGCWCTVGARLRLCRSALVCMLYILQHV